ncbi:MAG: hypothetical protein UV50_C0017G0014 [Parcubacteria group bacterium GW2011_GWB1_42_9]|nr:MAG: hypothetical protein UV50_C0017G0014 [Parcubacteria group bacterium GW2011_GWB1_42_9]
MNRKEKFMCEAFVSVVGGSKQGPTSAMDWPIIGGQPVDLARLAEISGREERYVYGLVDRIRSASRIKLPTPSAKLSEELSAIDNLGVIYDSYLCTRNPMIRASIMVRWIQLAQTEIEFRKPSPFVSSGTELEIYFLWHVARICPGE